MKIETKFDLGQTVYFIEENTVQMLETEPCDVCNETGRVKIKGQEYMCPKCGGRLTKYKETTVNDICQGVIEEIVIYASGHYYTLEEGDYIGHDNNLYATLEDAQIEYDKTLPEPTSKKKKGKHTEVTEEIEPEPKAEL